MADGILCAGRTAKIYALIDPRDGRPRYVGQTRGRYLCNRLAQHVCRADRTPKSEWVQDLLLAGLRPSIELLEEVTLSRGDEVEDIWIQRLSAVQTDLLNRRDGGLRGRLSEESKGKISRFRQGFVGWTHESSTKAKIARCGEANHASKLTNDIVLLVRELHASKIRQSDIALHLGLSRQSVNGVVLRKTWRHI